MLKDITLGQYYPGDSFIHRLDPRVKILLSFLFMIALFFINKFYPYLFILAFLCLIIKASNIPFSYTIKGIKPMWPLLLITFLVNALLGQGEIWYRFGFLKITPQSML